MADFAAKKNSYADRLTQRATYLLEVLDDLAGLRKEWDEVGLGDGGPAEIADEDLAARFPHLTAADLASAMNTIDALLILRSQGHGTNLARLRG